MRRDQRLVWIALGLTLPFAGILALHAWHYLPFISDDALISLRYAQRLLDGHGLTWTEGRPVEGYSNLLWILLVAGLGALGVDLIDASRLLGFGCMAAAMLSLAHHFAGRAAPGKNWFPITLGLLFLSLAAPIAVWTIGGLEQPLYGALIAMSIPLLYSTLERPDQERRHAVYLSLALGLLCLTRPDGPIFTVAAALVLAGTSWSRREPFAARLMVVVAVPALFYLSQLIFRFFYYGELVPNTALVKISPGLRWHDGWLYLEGGMRALSPFSFLAIASLVGLLLLRPTRRRGIALVALSLGWAVYIVSIGGDIFPAYRHLVPMVVIFAFSLAEGAELVVRRLSRRPAQLYAFGCLLLLLFVPFTRTQLSDKQSQRAIRERWEWDCKELGRVLRSAFARQQPLVGVTAAGCVPYWSELPALDMMGLNDHYLPRHPPADVGTGMIGHELGDGAYVLRRQPDLIVFNVGSGPHYRSGEELDRMPEFHERYVPVRVTVPRIEPGAIVYVNKESSKPGIGISRSGSQITVPGFLLTGQDTVAALNQAGTLIARVGPHDRATVSFRSDEPLTGWTIRVETPDPAGVVATLDQQKTSVSVVVQARRSEPVEIGAIVLRAQ